MNVDTLDYDFNFPGLQRLVLQYSHNYARNTVHPMDLIDSVIKGIGKEGITTLYLSCISQLRKNKKTTNSLADMVNWIDNFKQKNLLIDDMLIGNVSLLVKGSDVMSVEEGAMTLSKKRKFVLLSNGEEKSSEVTSEPLQKKPKLYSVSDKEMNDPQEAIIASSKQQIKRGKRGRTNVPVETVSAYAQFIMDNIPEHKSEASWKENELKMKAVKGNITQLNRNALKRGIFHMKDCSLIPARHRETAQRFFAYLYTKNEYKYSAVNERCEYCKGSERSEFSEATPSTSPFADHANMTTDVSASQVNLYPTTVDSMSDELTPSSVAFVGEVDWESDLSLKENFFRSSNESSNTDRNLASLAIPVGQKSLTLLKTIKFGTSGTSYHLRFKSMRK